MPLGGLGICGGGSEKPGSRRSGGGVESVSSENMERTECVGDVGVMERGGMKSGGGLGAKTVACGALSARTLEADDSDDSGFGWL